MRSVPGVRTASFSSITPIGHSSWNEELVIDGYTPKSDFDGLANFNEVSPGYFAALGTPLLAGRDFNEHDTPESTTVAIINETMARKFFGNASPLGARFRTRDGKNISPPVEIIGVAKDSKYISLREVIEPAAYLAIYQHKELPVHMSFEILAAGSPAGLMPNVTKAVVGMNPGIRVDFITLSNQVNESLKREGLLATLSGFFGILALTLATIGLYGVMSYKMARRRNEIGIRMALGAGRREIMEMVLREALLLAGIGIAVGIPVSLAATRIAASAISTLLYGLKATDVTTMAIATLALMVVAAFAGLQPARRASRIDPVNALRDE
jgi:putative ABC transport system permease protein